MCGSFSLEHYPTIIVDYFDLPMYPKFNPKSNISPSTNILTIFNSPSGYEVGEMHRGLFRLGQKRDNLNAHL